MIGSGIGKPRLSQDLWFSYLACCAFTFSQFSSNDLHRLRCGDQHTKCWPCYAQGRRVSDRWLDHRQQLYRWSGLSVHSSQWTLRDWTSPGTHMYVCIYVCMYVCVCTMYVSMYVCMYVCISYIGRAKAADKSPDHIKKESQKIFSCSLQCSECNICAYHKPLFGHCGTEASHPLCPYLHKVHIHVTAHTAS